VAVVVRDAVDATTQLFREKRVALSVAAARPTPSVRADRDRLIQVLINLLSNAVKFCLPDVGRVEVRIGAADGAVQVDVTDNGPGIPREDHETIFERFKRHGDMLASRPQGSGLGLAISRRIVEHFGGRLWVESDVGKGATFSFTLPLEAPAPTGDGERARVAG
jgi:signal transduction histidine kinase